MNRQKPVSLADQVFTLLETDILSGKIAQGEIITEIGIAEKLGVSRTPVREAFRRLIQDHMISDSDKGILVVGISEKDAEAIYNIRERIEGLVAGAAAENITPEQLAELKDIVDLQAFYAQRGETEKIREYDSRFHTCMYRASGCSIYYDTLSDLHRKIQKYRTISVSRPLQAHDSIEEHRRIYDALAARDKEAVIRLADEHIRNARMRTLHSQNSTEA